MDITTNLNQIARAIERRRPTTSIRQGKHVADEEYQEEVPAIATTVPARASTSVIRDKTRSPEPSRPTLRRSSSERTPSSPIQSQTPGLDDIHSDDVVGLDASDDEIHTDTKSFEDATYDGENQEAIGSRAYDYHNVATDGAAEYEGRYEQQEQPYQFVQPHQPVQPDQPQQGADLLVTNDGRPLETEPLMWHRTHRCMLFWMSQVDKEVRCI